MLIADWPWTVCAYTYVAFKLQAGCGHRLLLASWKVLSRSIAIPKQHRHRHLLRHAFSALQAAARQQAAQLGHFWERWQVHFPQQRAMVGWKAVRVATARQRVQEAWGERARQCLLQRRAFVAWKAVVAVQYSQACKLQVPCPLLHCHCMHVPTYFNSKRQRQVSPGQLTHHCCAASSSL